MSIEDQVLDTEITPQHKHKQKLIKDESKRKKSAKVAEQYLEVISDHQHKKGGKIRLVKRMVNGNVHRSYVGREKQPEVKLLLAKYKAQGLKVLR